VSVAIFGFDLMRAPLRPCQNHDSSGRLVPLYDISGRSKEDCQKKNLLILFTEGAIVRVKACLLCSLWVFLLLACQSRDFRVSSTQPSSGPQRFVSPLQRDEKLNVSYLSWPCQGNVYTSNTQEEYCEWDSVPASSFNECHFYSTFDRTRSRYMNQKAKTTKPRTLHNTYEALFSLYGTCSKGRVCDYPTSVSAARQWSVGASRHCYGNRFSDASICEVLNAEYEVRNASLNDPYQILVVRPRVGTKNKGLSQNNLDISGIDCVVPFSVEIAT
jgi:hypothetical protein